MSYYKAETVRKVADGKWLFILEHLAPKLEAAIRKSSRHVTCPIHGTTERHGKGDGFRLYKDVNQTGGGVCNTCGPRKNGFELLMWVNKWSFKECLTAVGDYLGVETVKPEYQDAQTPKAKAKTTSNQPESWLIEIRDKMDKQMERDRANGDRLREKNQKIWSECLLFSNPKTEPMRLYFKSRGLLFNVKEVEKTDCLRFHPAMAYYDEDGKQMGVYPAIVCAIRDIQGNLVTLHRTYLTNDGKKAQVTHVKKMMPIPTGLDVNGAAVRLGEPTEGILGVAEGLETALSAYRVTQIPVWSTVNATLMESFELPDRVHTVLIWADKDKSSAGEKSAGVLKAKLENLGVQVYVLLPKVPISPDDKGVDWNDVLISQGLLGFPSAHYLRDFIVRRRAEYGRS